MKKIIDKFKAIMEVLFGIIGILMILIETYAVFSRNILKASSSWTDETLKVMFVWVIFICAAIAFLDDGMIAMTLIEDKSENNRKLLGAIKICQFIFALIFSAALTVQSIQIVSSQMASGAKTAVMGYPLWVSSSGLMIGSVLTGLIALYKLYDCKKYFAESAVNISE